MMVACILMETVAAAPVFDENLKSTQQSRISKNPRQKKKGIQNFNGKKNLDRQMNLFDDEAVGAWQNPCNSIGWDPAFISEQNYNTSYQNVS